MKSLIAWWKNSPWARPLRIESRAEWLWTIGLALPFVALLIFVDKTEGNKKQHWSGQFERALERRQPEQMPRWEQAGQWQRLQMIFDARFAHPRQLSSRQQIKAREYGKTRFWWIARGNALLLFLLWPSRACWIGPSKPQAQNTDARPPPQSVLSTPSKPPQSSALSSTAPLKGRASLLWWLGLLLIVATALSLQLPRLQLSLYNDEVMNFKEFIHGKYRGWDPGEELKFDQRRWERTAWDNRYGFNPVGFSTLTRLGYDRWAEATEAAPAEVGEWVLRLPSLIGGLLVLLALALGLRSSGLPLAGLLASFFWAIHPWAMRFASEGRPHGLMMGLASCLLVAMICALKSGSWKAWLAVALLEALALWVSAGALWMVFCMNLFVLGVLFWRALQARDVGLWQLRRFLAASFLGSLLFFQLAGPSLPDFWMAVNRVEEGGIIKPLKDNWWKDVGASLSTGRPFSDGHSSPQGAPTWEESSPWLMWTWASLLLLTLGSGVKLWLKRRKHDAQEASGLGLWFGICGAVMLSAPLAFVMSWRGGTVLHSWYVVHLTIPTALLFGLSTALLFEVNKQQAQTLFGRTGKVACLVLPLFAVLVFASPLSKLQSLPKQNVRGLAEAMGGVYPHNLPAEEMLRGLSFNDADFYDPFIEEVSTTERIQAMEAESLQRGIPLRFAVGHLSAGSASTERIWEYLNQSPDWKLKAEFPGLEEYQFASWVFAFEPE